MLAKDCQFPKFISALLLLNASIFFVLFMNFYIQNYKKRRTMEQEQQQKQKIQAATCAAEVVDKNGNELEEAKKVKWRGICRSQT